MPNIGDIAKARDIGRAGKQKWIWASCENCGKVRWVLFRKGKPEWQICRKCAGIEKRGKRCSPLTEFRKGQKPHNYKGGRMVNRGYIFLLIPNHPRANSLGYVAEHLIKWEEYHNSKLPEGYVVHHINGVKDDNRPKNLLAMSRRGHSPSLTVKEVQARLREVEAELAQGKMI